MGEYTMSKTYTVHSITSKDGTTIGYRQLGRGPGLIIVHGGMQASQHFMKLAAALADMFTVYLPDRRGRGLSGGFGDEYSVQKDCEDMSALARHTGAHGIFGLSSGAIIALRTAVYDTTLRKVALYEPPLSVNGSSPTHWVPRYEAEVAAGNLTAALVTVLKGVDIVPGLTKLPRFVLMPMMTRLIESRDTPQGDDVALRTLIPTQHYDMQIVRETADTMGDYAALDAEVLLLGGTKSPAFLRVALDALERTLPHSQRITFPGLAHSGPDNDGKPEVVAAALRKFFAAV
jgi:pimeloyl-ACP methyl ester carboxylesterase